MSHYICLLLYVKYSQHALIEEFSKVMLKVGLGHSACYSLFSCRDWHGIALWTWLLMMCIVVAEVCYSKFDVLGSVHRKHILKYNQENATLHNLFISVKCCACFRRFFRPSSGAQNCIYSIEHFVKPLLLPATVVAGSSKGFTNYPMLYIQF